MENALIYVNSSKAIILWNITDYSKITLLFGEDRQKMWVSQA